MNGSHCPKNNDSTIDVSPPNQRVAKIKNAASIIAYCNTGHLGSIDWFVLTQILGRDHVMLYDGSMAEWSRSDLPVVTGASG